MWRQELKGLAALMKQMNGDDGKVKIKMEPKSPLHLPASVPWLRLS